MGYMPREMESEFRATCAEYPVVLVVGVRRDVGEPAADAPHLRLSCP